MFCAALFLLGGGLLLALNYVLVSAALPVPDQEFRSAEATPGQSASRGASPGAGEAVDLDAGPNAGVVSMDMEKYRSSVLRTLLGQSLVTLAASASIAVALGWVVARRMLRPVRQMASTARRLSADNLDQRIEMRGPRDELTDLADTFDQMLDRLAASFDSQRRFVANASHELRTPLAAQRTMIEVAMNRPGAPPATRQLCQRLLTMNERSEALIEGLLTLAASDRGLASKLPVRIDQVVRNAAAGNAAAATSAGVRLHVDTAPVAVPGDRVLLERLVGNLLDNAIKYNNRGEVWLRVDERATVTVTNTGPAVPDAAADELFEPFRQLRRDRTGVHEGVGLGLSIVASIARAHGGAVVATPRAGGGLSVTVRLPHANAENVLI